MCLIAFCFSQAVGTNLFLLLCPSWWWLLFAYEISMFSHPWQYYLASAHGLIIVLLSLLKDWFLNNCGVDRWIFFSNCLLILELFILILNCFTKSSSGSLWTYICASKVLWWWFHEVFCCFYLTFLPHFPAWQSPYFVVAVSGTYSSPIPEISVLFAIWILLY